MSNFSSAGQEPGLEIWRIEDFEAVPYDTANYGKFHTGDSYVVLKTTLKGGKLCWDLHFWLGQESSQDEQGTAAIKAVELDTHLGGSPVQHREVQEHESSLFESHFKKGIKYLPGGVKSGFTHVDPEAVEKRLFIVKGKRNIKVKQVDLCFSSLNKSDCFILDCGKNHDIFVYMPDGASRMERFRANQAATEIRDEDHAGNANVEIIDAFSDDASKFFEALGGGCSEDVPDSSNEPDHDAPVTNVVLLRVSDNGDEDIEVEEVSGKPLSQDLLNPQDCFILNSGSANGIFVWIGSGSTSEERLKAFNHAEAYLAKSGLPKWTKVTRIVEHAETAAFKQYFSIWKEPEESASFGLGRVYPREAIAEWDVASLHAENRRRLSKSGGAAIGFMPDDSKGAKEIYRIEDMELAHVPDENGFFFGGDSYVIKYTYDSGCIIYFWLGGNSSQDEKAAAALQALKMDQDLSGQAVQVRVVQGLEPRHFIKMFNGEMVVFMGGKASGFKNVHDHDTYDTDGTRLFRIRCTSLDDLRAEQVAEVAPSLISEDVFLLETPSVTYLWIGQASEADELEAAKRMAEKISPGRTLLEVKEGSEPEGFWDGLGGNNY